jgi:hypothetical protein
VEAAGKPQPPQPAPRPRPVPALHPLASIRETSCGSPWRSPARSRSSASCGSQRKTDMGGYDISLSDSKSTAAAAGSGSYSIGGNTYASNPVVWIVVGVVALFGLVVYLKLR